MPNTSRASPGRKTELNGSPPSGTESLQTLRWRELDSKFQFRAEMGFGLGPDGYRCASARCLGGDCLDGTPLIDLKPERGAADE